MSAPSHNTDIKAASSGAAFNPSGLSLAEPSDFFALMKPRVMSLVVFTAWAGLVLAPGTVPLWAAIASIICIAAGAGASGALNMWYDADIDAQMSRTKKRPIPQGKMTPRAALGFGTAISFAIYFMRADFVAPQAWQARFEATQIRTGHSGTLGDMNMVQGSSLVLLALLAGYALLALLASERGHRVAKGGGAMLGCVLAATVINTVVLYVLRATDAGIAVAGVWLFIQPIVALWLPLYFFGEPEND